MNRRYHFHLDQKTEAASLVRKYHYSHRVPNMVVVGTWHEDGGLFGDSGPAVAACIFSNPPTRWSEPVLELVRLVRTPECTQPLSGLIGATVRYVRKLTEANLLVSFADTTQEHHGGVYQASSWKYHGKRNATMDGIVVGGRFVPGRTAVQMFGTRSPTKLAERGIEVEPHYDTGKHLYWRPLNRNGERAADRLGLEARPYPKPDEERNPTNPKRS